MKNIDADCLLEIENLKVHFSSKGHTPIRAVDGVSFAIRRGSTVGLVGESGSGKTTIGRAIVRLSHLTAGGICYAGREISSLPERDFFPYRKKIQMVFQDASLALNPRLTIEALVAEPLIIHFPHWDKARKRARVVELLETVGLEEAHLDRFPQEFSGGQRQRIGIARALAVEPELLICDEPVSALDVSVQAQIINLLMDLQEKLGLTYLFISHDLAVIEHVSEYVLVMADGKIVEQAPADEIYAKPKHDYTKKLLASAPNLEGLFTIQ